MRTCEYDFCRRTRNTTYQHDNDASSDLDYAMARYYASRSGRFMTPDPGHVGANIGDPQSWNAYVYSRNDPVNLVDPNGTEYMDCPWNDGCYSPGGLIMSDRAFDSFVAFGAYHVNGNILEGDDSVPLYFFFRTSIDGIDLKVSDAGVADRYLDQSVNLIRGRQEKGQFSEQCHATLKAMGTSMEAILSALDKRRWFDGTVSSDPVLRLPKWEIARWLAAASPSVGMHFKAYPDIAAMSETPGSAVYFRPRAVLSNSVRNNAVLMIHETSHNLTGKMDWDLQRALGLEVSYGSRTGNISSRIRNDCF